MEKELAQSDLHSKRKFPNTIRKYHLYQSIYLFSPLLDLIIHGVRSLCYRHPPGVRSLCYPHLKGVRLKHTFKKYQKLVHNRCARWNLCNLYNTWHFHKTLTKKFQKFYNTFTILSHYFYNTITILWKNFYNTFSISYLKIS